MKQYIIFIMVLLFHLTGWTQEISGRITGEQDQKKMPLAGANVYWLETFEGTTTDADGKFTLSNENQLKKLVISFVGYVSDTIDVNGLQINVNLKPTLDLKTFTVEAKNQSTKISLLDPINAQILGEEELAKAPCCNLSESFETNASIDASFSDAVSGTKQIKMLGLSGAYIQTMQENMPGIRGLWVLRGLGYIPGPWLKSIQISKGAGSVVNGFESMSGQINLEIKKPEGKEKLLINSYANQGGRLELNLLGATQVNEKWHTSILLNGSTISRENDMNDDGFLDMPTGDHIHVMNRWKYFGNNGWEGQVGIRYSSEDKLGGQKGFDEGTDRQELPFFNDPAAPLYGIKIETQLINGWAKMGKVIQNRPGSSFGFQASGTSYTEDTYFGMTDYKGEQQSIYLNAIYQSILGNTNHQYKTGVSTQADQYKEEYGLAFTARNELSRDEIVPGAFFEYTYLGSPRWNVVAGIRADYHSIFGFYTTPRLHTRFSVDENTSLKLAVGQGRRTANILAENVGLMARFGSMYVKTDDDRFIEIGSGENTSDLPYYGLDQEVSWNTGLNLTKKFTLDYREGSVAVDFYHSRFENLVVVDQYFTPQSITFYNLDGESYTNSFQIEVNYELIKRLDLRMAYRWVEAYTDYYQQGAIIQPFTAKNRAFVNVEYKTRKNKNWGQWKFDITGQWMGQQAIPLAVEDERINRPYSYSDDYFVINAQVTKVFNKKFNMYVGVENLFNYRQNNPIYGADTPYQNSFDASKVWAPIFGRNIYVGLNYKLTKEE